MNKIKITKLATLTGHKDCIYTLEKADKDNVFFSGDGDGMVVAWDFKNPDTGKLIAKTDASVYALHYMPGLNYLIVGENFAGLHIIDLKENKEIKFIRITSAAIFDIKVFENVIFVATGDGEVILVNKNDFSLLNKIKLSEKSARAIAICQQKEEFAVGYSDNHIRIFDLKDHTLKQTISAHDNSVFTIVYSPDGKYLLSGGRDAHIKVWDVPGNYKLFNDIVAHMYTINHITYRPDGKYFLTSSMDKSIKVWDADKFKLLKVIDKSRHAGHGTSVNKLYWSKHKEQVASCSDDKTISIWKIAFGRL